MKIVKKGKVIPFICGSCRCEFLAGINGIQNNNGNYYAECPMCGTDCHTDIVDIQRYEEKQKQKVGG